MCRIYIYIRILMYIGRIYINIRIRDSAVDGTLSHLVVRIRDSAVDGTLSHLVVRIHI